MGNIRFCTLIQPTERTRVHYINNKKAPMPRYIIQKLWKQKILQAAKKNIQITLKKKAADGYHLPTAGVVSLRQDCPLQRQLPTWSPTPSQITHQERIWGSDATQHSRVEITLYVVIQHKVKHTSWISEYPECISRLQLSQGEHHIAKW